MSHISESIFVVFFISVCLLLEILVKFNCRDLETVCTVHFAYIYSLKPTNAHYI